MFKKNKENSIYEALKVLLNISKESQEQFESEKKNKSALEWAQDFCTIRLNGPRRAGHTYSALKLILEEKMNIGYISGLDSSKAEMFKDLYNEEVQNDISKWEGYYQWSHRTKPIIGELLFYSSLHNIKSNLKNNLRGIPSAKYIDAIVVDNSSYLTQDDIDNIYELGCSLFSRSYKNNYYYIFLQ